MRIIVGVCLILILSSFVGAKALSLIYKAPEPAKATAIHFDAIAELDSGKSNITKLMSEIEEEIKTLDQELESINHNMVAINSNIAAAQDKTDHALEEVIAEVAKADQTTLDKYASGDVDIAVTEYKDNVPYQKDIFKHSKELYEQAPDTETEVLSL